MERANRMLTKSIIRETVKRELGIIPDEEIYAYGEIGKKGKTHVSYDYSISITDAWFVLLEFYGKKGYIELSKHLTTEQELIDLIKYFKKLKKVR